MFGCYPWEAHTILERNSRGVDEGAEERWGQGTEKKISYHLQTCLENETQNLSTCKARSGKCWFSVCLFFRKEKIIRDKRLSVEIRVRITIVIYKS